MENQLEGDILAIGQQFTNETGEKQVPVYTRHPKTGMMVTNLFNIGQDQGVIEQNKSLEQDINFAIEDIQKNGNDPEAINHYKTELQTQYGDEAISKLEELLTQND